MRLFAFVLGALLALPLGAQVRTPNQSARPDPEASFVYMLVREGATDGLRIKLDTGWDPNTRYLDGATALMWAVGTDQEKVASFLFDHGARVDQKDRFGRAALHHAAWGSSTVMARLLLARGANPNARDAEGQSPLHRCVSWTFYDTGSDEGQPACLRLLAKAGGQIDAKDKLGRTPLMWAAAKWHAPGLKELVRLGAKLELQDPQGRAALTWAASWNDGPCVKALLSAGAKVRLVDALELGDVKTARKLLAGRGSERPLGANGETTLMLASLLGEPDLVNVLLKRGCNPNAVDERGLTPLQVAFGVIPERQQAGGVRWRTYGRKGSREAVVRMLLGKGARPNRAVAAPSEYGVCQEGDVPLTWAAMNGDVGSIRALIKVGAYPDGKASRGGTDRTIPLVAAVSQGHVEAARVLIGAGAHPDLGHPFLYLYPSPIENDNYRPITPAARIAIVRLLIEAGALYQDEDGAAALRQAIDHEDIGVARLLVTAKVRLNLLDVKGNSALIDAVAKKNLPIVDLLIAAGANPLLKNQSGQTARDLAERSGYAEIAKALAAAENKWPRF